MQNHEEIEDTINRIVATTQTQTIADVQFTPFIKRNLVDRVPEDSEYRRSFDEYLLTLANHIATGIDPEILLEEEVVLINRIMFQHIHLELADPDRPEEQRFIQDITLNADDFDRIVNLVRENLRRRS